MDDKRIQEIKDQVLALQSDLFSDGHELNAEIMQGVHGEPGTVHYIGAKAQLDIISAAMESIDTMIEAVGMAGYWEI